MNRIRIEVWCLALMFLSGATLMSRAEETAPLPAPGAILHFEVIDADSGVSLPARIHLRDAAGQPLAPQGLPFFKDHFVCPGTASVPVPDGTFHYEIERGCEYTRVAGAVTADPCAAPTVRVGLRRLADLAAEHWYSGDLHVHRAANEIELLMRAEDLHVAPLLTWWNSGNIWLGRALPDEPWVRFDGDRFYFLLGGEDERDGGANLFYNLRVPIDITWARRHYPCGLRFVENARWQSSCWIDVEKPFWQDVPLMLAYGYADSMGIAHNHLWRTGGLDNEAWGRPRDRAVYPGPHGCGLWSQAIYYHALNCGFRLPPTAGSATGVLPNPLGYNRVYVHVDEEPLAYDTWWRQLAAGRCFVTNGPLLRVQADGFWPGEVFTLAAGQTREIRLTARLAGNDPVNSLEIIQNGAVLRRVPVDEMGGAIDLGAVPCDAGGWFLVRAIADVPETFRFASTGPFYVEQPGRPRFVSGASAQFFLDWARQRLQQIHLDDAQQLEEVLKYHRTAVSFWERLVAEATAP